MYVVGKYVCVLIYDENNTQSNILQFWKALVLNSKSTTHRSVLNTSYKLQKE